MIIEYDQIWSYLKTKDPRQREDWPSKRIKDTADCDLNVALQFYLPLALSWLDGATFKLRWTVCLTKAAGRVRLSLRQLRFSRAMIIPESQFV